MDTLKIKSLVSKLTIAQLRINFSSFMQVESSQDPATRIVMLQHTVLTFTNYFSIMFVHIFVFILSYMLCLNVLHAPYNRPASSSVVLHVLTSDNLSVTSSTWKYLIKNKYTINAVVLFHHNITMDKGFLTNPALKIITY
jgi:hypothetical protein